MTTPTHNNLPVNPDRIAADIDALAAITEPDRPWTRRAFTPKFLEGRAWLADAFRIAGLDVQIDAAGNLIGRRAGSEPGRGTIMVGSHSDTVPDGGRFDGVAGVIAALEVARSFNQAGIALRHDLEIVDFLAEEVSIFGVSCIGSRGLSGVLPEAWLGRESDGLSLRDGVIQVGGDPSRLSKRENIKAFLELHIEQGRVLEVAERDIGVVTAIAGITRIEIVVEGRADHAGTTPMGTRADALAAASEIVLEVERLGLERSRGQFHFAATVGEFAIEPNAANVVPSHVRLLIDARAERRDDMDAFVREIEAVCAGVIARRAGIGARSAVISDNAPTPCDADVQAALKAGAGALEARSRHMASGAGHDTAWMARITKAGMIFIPCRDGRSHTPEEWADNADIALGAAVLLEAVRRLDETL
jgi:beta-ureidopropionase / N-carbamoyl-L-amino-acid hydrolase